METGTREAPTNGNADISRKKVDTSYDLVRSYLEPLYMIRRSEKIIAEEERINGQSPAKNLVRIVAYGWEAIKLTGIGIGAQQLYDYIK